MTETKNNKKSNGGFFSRTLLLILSFIIAIVLWYMGTTQNQTQIARMYSDITVKFINEDILEGASLTVEQLESVTVDAVLKGYYSDITEINAYELIAVIDLSEYRIAGKYTVMPLVEGCGQNISTQKIDSVDIIIEKIITKQLNIDIELKGAPATGYLIDKDNIRFPETVEVKCGESMSKNVAGAKLVIDATDRNTDFTVNLNIILLDAQGHEIDSSRIDMQYYSVSVSVPVKAIYAENN